MVSLPLVKTTVTISIVCWDADSANLLHRCLCVDVRLNRAGDAVKDKNLVGFIGLL